MKYLNNSIYAYSQEKQGNESPKKKKSDSSCNAENTENQKASQTQDDSGDKKLSVMDPIDTVFKIVNLAPAPGSSFSTTGITQSQSSNGPSLKSESNMKNQSPSFLSKSRTSEWFTNLFSPNKTKNSPPSADTR